MDKGTEILGWVSSIILVFTIGRQVYKQWKDGTSEGVSRWLFLGQCTAEVGFIIYSWKVRNWVFVFTNVALLLESLLGYWLVRCHKKQEEAGGSAKLAAT